MDNAAIAATLMDCFGCWFDSDAERMTRALHSNLNQPHLYSSMILPAR